MKKKEENVQEIHRFKVVAVAHGFANSKTSPDGSTLWLSRPKTDPDQEEQKICIDSLTLSVTVFPKVGGSFLKGTTFRNADALQIWLDQPRKTVVADPGGRGRDLVNRSTSARGYVPGLRPAKINQSEAIATGIRRHF